MSTRFTHSVTADLIRVISILFVVVTHIYSKMLDTAVFNSFTTFWAIFFQSITKLGVPLFIMLSGYLLLHRGKLESIDTFYKKRIARIGLPILFWPIFYYSIFVWLGPKTFSIGAFITDYVFLDTFFHLYFLYIMAGLYLLTPYLRLILHSLNKAQSFKFSVIALLFSLLITPLVYLTTPKLNYWSIFTVFIPYIGYFIFGDALREKRFSLRSNIWLSLVFVTIIVGTTVLKFFAFHSSQRQINNYLNDVFSFFVMPASLILFVLLSQPILTKIVTEKTLFKKSLTLISECSFGIYLIHPAIMYVLDKPIGYSFFAIPYLGSVFMVSLTITWLIKKLPYINTLVG